ncbi:MAG: hypothetical protein ACXABY_10765 [Candidatus Thorarchaeota archaeon]|jgi:hypothetical protein
MKRVIPILFATIFLASFFIVPVGNAHVQTGFQETIVSDEVALDNFEQSMYPLDRPIRVALYYETNTTGPDYATGTMAAYFDEVFGVLDQAGYQVTNLTLQDIQNRELKTANYDVFVLADNCPRENITDIVKEFWLGGGALLGFDSAAAYLGHAGILPRESLGSDGWGVYWTYLADGIANVSVRHPVTKSSQIDDQLTYPGGTKATYDWTALQGTSIAADLVKLAIHHDNDNNVVAIAEDPSDMGGKVVQIGTPTGTIDDWHSIIIDAVEWLSPIPKDRILYDLTHLPHVGVDLVDSDLISGAIYSWPWRNDLVSMRYTFDKLYPSSAGNLTPANLAPYDILIISISSINFTSSEITAVENWVSAGGGLVLIGEAHPGVFLDMVNINKMAEPYGMQIKDSYYNSATFNPTFTTPHPITESVTNLETVGHGAINTTGDAYPIFFEGSDAVVTASEFGEGRVILTDDRLIFDNANYFVANNEEFSKNIVHWVGSADAKVLIYAYTTGVSNMYREPLAEALNDLGVSYYLTSDGLYTNVSLYTKSWDLLIHNANNLEPTPYHDDFIAHMESGGRYIVRSFYMKTDAALWDYIGIKGNGSSITSGPPTLHIWDIDHPIFSIPSDFSNMHISSTTDALPTDYCYIEPLENATALVGVSHLDVGNVSALVLSNNGQALANAFAIDEYGDDSDDTTYPDNLRLWQNEIAFMLRPVVDSQPDIEYEAGSTGHVITWNPTSRSPQTYHISVDGSEQIILWDGSMIEFNADGLDPGVHTINLTVYDSLGESESDEVLVTVVDTTPPSISSPPDATMLVGTIGNDLSWTCFDLYPDNYTLYVNGTIEGTSLWDGGNIDIIIDNLELGVYNYTLLITDESGNSASDTIMVSVIAAPAIDSTTLLLILGAVAAVLVIGAIACKMRGGEAAAASKTTKRKPRKKK